MKTTPISLALALSVLATSACYAEPESEAGKSEAGKSEAGKSETGKMTDEEKVFYAIGVSMSGNLDAFDMSEDEIALVVDGLRDGAHGKVDFAVEEYGSKIVELRTARAAGLAESEKAAAEGFLDEEASKEGVEKTESGLLYSVIEEGTGESPENTDTVSVHYRGTLRDGTEFDSSHKRGQPATFPLGNVIPCWTEGVAKMKVGGKSRLVCPSDIAYGDRGASGVIPPGAALVFEVELLEIK